MTTSLQPTATSTTEWARFLSLAKAEFIQFFRNPTLMAMALVMPALFAGGMYAMGLISSGENPDFLAAGAVTTEMFMVMALIFVQFYSVLSITAVRRDEGVLKRLRSGESKDLTILLAICAPGFVVLVLSSAVFIALISLIGGHAPANPWPLLLVVLAGGVISAALAFVTAGFTRNAEAAQITSMPISVFALVSMLQVVEMMPERVTEIMDRTPFTILNRLIDYSWTGTAQSLAAELSNSLLILLAWVVACVWWAARTMRWETHRG